MRWLVVLLLLTSCEKEVDDIFHIHHWVTYTIPQGTHRSTTQLAPFSGHTLEFHAIFDSSAKYTIPNSNQTDINKLYGFSNGANHEANSARFGWVWNNKRNVLEIYSYCYVNKIRSYKYIADVDLYRDYLYKIDCVNSEYIFTLNGGYETKLKYNGEGSIKYYLFPYFGGDEVAPHNVTIQIKEISN